jgi:hypothetical protein
LAEKKGKREECASVRIHPLVKVFSSGEEVGNSISVSRDVFEHEVKVLQELHPSGLSAHDFLGLTEILKIFVVGSDVDRVVGAKEVGVSAFKSIDNGGHFFVVNVILSLHW